jgi:hypothetical protein
MKFVQLTLVFVLKIQLISGVTDLTLWEEGGKSKSPLKKNEVYISFTLQKKFLDMSLELKQNILHLI